MSLRYLDSLIYLFQIKKKCASKNDKRAASILNTLNKVKKNYTFSILVCEAPQGKPGGIEADLGPRNREAAWDKVIFI